LFGNVLTKDLDKTGKEKLEGGAENEPGTAGGCLNPAALYLFHAA